MALMSPALLSFGLDSTINFGLDSPISFGLGSPISFGLDSPISFGVDSPGCNLQSLSTAFVKLGWTMASETETASTSPMLQRRAL